MEKQTFEKLKTLLGKDQVCLDSAELLVYETDAALDRGAPDAVVFAHSMADVQRVVHWCTEMGVALIARGAGTGLSGGAVAEKGGVILEFSRMNRILEIDPLGRSAMVEPGVVNMALDEAVRRQGLYYPPDPASGRSATLGGNTAENAGGPHCFKYGVTTNYITGLEFVLPDGQALMAGGYAFDYPEFDFTGLLVGSEGTLAIVTRILARLLRVPPGVKTMMAAFQSVEAAGAAVSTVISAGLVPATMEMMDQKIARIVEDYAHPGIPVDAGALLIVEVDGYPEGLDPQIDEIAHILESCGGYDLRIANSLEARERIWFARKSAAGAMARLAPAYLLLDGTVPRSQLARTLETTNRICDQYGLQVGYVFHAGDGNLHPFILTDPRNPDLLQRAHLAGREFMQAVTALGGSITGEHGVGIEKRHYLHLMYTPEEMSLMQDVKQVFDPQQIFNPGKIFPDGEDLAVQKSAPSAGAVKKDSLLPPPVFLPSTAGLAAEGLAALSRAGEALRVYGGEAERRRDSGRALFTGGMRGVAEFAPNDLYVTAGAGTPVDELLAFLHERGFQAALLSPWPQATLGGLLAANLNSPMRMRYGGLRDQSLAMTIVAADGRIIHAGRPVVKNVAGYDLPKVMIGSYGVLGLIADVTLKVFALPRQRRSLLIPVNALGLGIRLAQACLSAAMVATGVVLGKMAHGLPVPAAPYLLVFSAEGPAEDVKSELALVKSRLAAAGAPLPLEIEGATAGDLWKQFLAERWSARLLLRVGLPPKDLARYLADQESALNGGDFLADFGSGLLYATAPDENFTAALSYLDRMRRPAIETGGYTIVLDAPTDLAERLDRWGYRPQTLELMKRLKSCWDPAGILNPGAFIL